jgi:tight adherence protein C
MTRALLAAAWAAVVIAAAWRFRPPPRRVRTLLGHGRAPATTAPGSGSTAAAGRVRARPPLAERIGGLILRRLRPSTAPPVAPATARRLGLAVLAGAAVLPAVPMAAPPAALLAWAAPAVAARRSERRRLAAIAADLPDVVDLLALGVGSGLTVHLAVARVAARASGPLAGELRRVLDEVGLGRRLADALDDLPARAGEDVRPLVGALVASERYGAPLVAGLERLADEVRRDRRRRAEEAARKVPVKLLFPLVTCTLPAFGLLTVAPLVASAIRSLRL